jgi:hypothetical protein
MSGLNPCIVKLLQKRRLRKVRDVRFESTIISSPTPQITRLLMEAGKKVLMT